MLWIVRCIEFIAAAEDQQRGKIIDEMLIEEMEFKHVWVCVGVILWYNNSVQLEFWGKKLCNEGESKEEDEKVVLYVKRDQNHTTAVDLNR